MCLLSPTVVTILHEAHLVFQLRTVPSTSVKASTYIYIIVVDMSHVDNDYVDIGCARMDVRTNCMSWHPFERDEMLSGCCQPIHDSTDTFQLRQVVPSLNFKVYARVYRSFLTASFQSVVAGPLQERRKRVPMHVRSSVTSIRYVSEVPTPAWSSSFMSPCQVSKETLAYSRGRSINRSMVDLSVI